VADDLSTEESWNVDAEPAVAAVRQRARELASELGLGARETESVAIAVSELAQNIVDHAGHGQVVLRTISEKGRRAVVVIARDEGPGISDLGWALTDGCSSADGLGSGLPAARRLMDEFSIDSAIGKGTVVTVRKWSSAPDEHR
jgi:serine/threonine-protein kinase RsbT